MQPLGVQDPHAPAYAPEYDGADSNACTYVCMCACGVSVRAMESRLQSETLPRPSRLHHMVEDFLTTWSTPRSHVLPLRRFLTAVLGSDVRSYFGETCTVAALTHAVLPESCRQQFLSGSGLQHPTTLFHAPAAAVKSM